MLRIRKLTPKECCRLMGFEDKDYEAMKEAGLSDSAIYHCCGDSIVVSVLISICSQLFEDINEKDIIYNYVKKYFAK
jgi:DNA (cytosine-5)-methyltransferase 1